MRVHQGDVNDAMNPNGGHQIDNGHINRAGPLNLDPARFTAADEYIRSQDAGD